MKSTPPGDAPTLVAIRGPTLDEWGPCAQAPAGRLLLLVPGLLPSVRSCFGLLAATPLGRRLLDAAIQRNDAIIGAEFDALRLDPLGNARQIARALGDLPRRVDLLAVGRGALVARALVERVLPESGWRGQVGAVMLVGPANGGTPLAHPRHRGRLARNIPSLHQAACEVARTLPGAMNVDDIAGAARPLSHALNSGTPLPGLDAMVPGGAFEEWLNGGVLPTSHFDAPRYHVVVSNFEPTLFEPASVARESGLAPALARKLATDDVPAVFHNAANDLVVDLACAWRVHPAITHRHAEGLLLPDNARVTHASFFLQPMVLERIADWLDLPTEGVFRLDDGFGPLSPVELATRQRDAINLG